MLKRLNGARQQYFIITILRYIFYPLQSRRKNVLFVNNSVLMYIYVRVFWVRDLNLQIKHINVELCHIYIYIYL